MSDTLSPFAPDRALLAHLKRPAAATRLWLLTHHQSASAGAAVYNQTTGLKPAFWPHVLIRKTHEKTGVSAGVIDPRFSRDRFSILATTRSDKLANGQTPRSLLEGLYNAIAQDLRTFAPTNTATGRVSRPKIANHAAERDYPAQGIPGVTIYELGFEVVFISS